MRSTDTMQTENRQSDTGAAGTGVQGGPNSKASEMRGQLRGLDFANGEALLAPGGAAEQAPDEAGAPAPRPKTFAHWFQGALNRALAPPGLIGRPLVVDGIIGAQTRATLKVFQRAAPTLLPSEPPLPVDGSIGPRTLGAIQRTIGEDNPFGREASPAPAAQKQPEQKAEDAPVDTNELTKVSAAPAANGSGEKAEEATPEPTPTDGAETELRLEPPPEVVAKVAEEVQAEQAAAAQNPGAAKADAAPAPTRDLAAMMKERLESARLELGLVKEKEWFSPPPFLRADLVPTFKATIEANKAKAGDKKRPAGVWFAKDQHSFDRLTAYAKTVQLDYEKTAVTVGYQWCGSFIAQHYGMTGTFEFVAGDESKAPAGRGKKPKRKATADGNLYLASTSKSFSFFNYTGEWSGAWIRDLSVANDRPVSERYQPIVPYHQTNGGARAWYPIDAWKSDPESVLLPGMILFVHGTDKYGKHMIFVDRVESDGSGGWVVHTVEGNAPGAGSAAGKYAIAANGKTVIRAAAKPSSLDFDTRITMLDKDMYARKLREESGA